MNKEELKQFIIQTNKAGYAGGEEKKWIKESDGSTTIPFEKGEWRSHDNFFGGEPYGGRTVVFHNGKPVWIMVYYGWISGDTSVDPIYAILRNALMKMPEEHPYRGPKEYKENEYTYTNSWQGELEQFSGEEKITQGKKLIYKASYLGGLVDQQRGI